MPVYWWLTTFWYFLKVDEGGILLLGTWQGLKKSVQSNQTIPKPPQFCASECVLKLPMAGHIVSSFCICAARTLEMKASEDPLLHSYGNWLACIAGSMASLAFVVAWLRGKWWKFSGVEFTMKCFQRSYHELSKSQRHENALAFGSRFQVRHVFCKPDCWLLKVEESAIDDTIVKEHCGQILDQPLD